MLTANEARQIANQRWIENFINPIEQCIRENIKVGYIDYSVSQIECQDIVDYLKENGYNVLCLNYEPEHNTTLLNISW